VMAGSPLCEPAFLQLARDRTRQSYVLSWHARSSLALHRRKDVLFGDCL
jgi:hypothetical protein